MEKHYIFDLPEIKAKETIVVEAFIKIPDGVGYLLNAAFFTEIYLEDPRNFELNNPCIHRCPYEIRTGFLYSPKKDQDILFVINDKVTLQEVKFIEEICQYYGLIYNFYDVCMQGTLDLFEPLPGQSTNLA